MTAIQNVSAVFFDMDGTLVDSEIYTGQSVARLCREFGMSDANIDCSEFDGVSWEIIAQGTTAIGREAENPEVKAVCGYGMHANGSVSNQCKSRRAEFICVYTDQRIRKPLANQFHVTVSIVESVLNILAELFVIHCHYRIAFVHRGRNDDGRMVIGQRQYSQRAAVVKTLERYSVIRFLVLHAANNAYSSEIEHRRRDTNHAPGL
jgi:beta-phosphoglucomutase-like phosphatase (HAD superfamily)